MIRRSLLGTACPLAFAALVGCDSTGPTDGLGDLPGECTQATALSLAVGEGVPLQGSSARRICIEGPSGGADYVLVTFSAATAFTNSTSFQALGENLAPAGSPLASLSMSAQERSSPGASSLQLGDDQERILEDVAFHHGMRERERRELGPRVRNVSDAAAGSWQQAPSGAPSVGALLTLNAQANQACENPITRTGRVEAVSQRAIVVADTLNPPGGFSRSDYEFYAVTFDTLIGPVAEQNFGAVSDIDGNERVILFYTQEVNRLTATDSLAFVGGFFFSRDLFPRTGTPRFQACPTSNEAEILYLLVPDPAGTIGGNERSIDFVRRFTLGTTVHEYQHLINAAQRLHIIESQTAFEETWLNEALSHTAEELLFFRTSGMSPGQNIGIDELRDVGQRAIDAINRHHISNILRFEEFLKAPESNSAYNPADRLATRGASRHFMRYALDRSGGNEASRLRNLVSSQSGGFQNLASAVGGSTTLQEWLADWAVAVYADSRVPNLPARYRDRSWNHASLFDALEISPYPLRTINLGNQQPVQRTLPGGAAAYLRFGVGGGEVGLVELKSGENNPPETLRVTLLRTR